MKTHPPFWTEIKIKDLRGEGWIVHCQEGVMASPGRLLKIRVLPRSGSKELKVPLEFSKPRKTRIDRALRSQMHAAPGCGEPVHRAERMMANVERVRCSAEPECNGRSLKCKKLPRCRRV